MGKTVRQILSPEQIQAGDRFLLQREQQKRQLREERERNDVLLRPDGGVDITNKEAQEGRRMHRSEFIRKVQKCAPMLWYEQSLRDPDKGGLYIADTSVPPYTKRMVASVPHGWISEFSVPLTVPSVIPSADLAPHWEVLKQVDSRIPGWRSILFRLAMAGLITKTQIETEFQLHRGRDSQRWQEAMQ